MKSFIPYLVMFLFIGTASFSQIRVIKPVKKKAKTADLSFGLGLTQSQLYLAQNVKENNAATGYHANVLYGAPNKNIRFSAEYTRYNTINIVPTWYNIKSSTLEANLHLYYKFESVRAYFYTISGFSYNVFSGYFTGMNDFLHLSTIYQTNAIAEKKWLGFNAGLGTEFFIKRFSIYGEYKMRVGTAEGNKQLTIMDVCLSLGVRYNMKMPSIYQMFRGTRSRYVLRKEDSER